jgi:uncharacterized protein YggE
MRPLLLAALIAVPAAAQTPTPLAAMPTTVSVVAESRVERAPDIADISAGVVSPGSTAAEAMRVNAERMATVIAAVRRAGIADRDVQTAGISLQPQYLYRENQPPQLTGYQASNSVNVRLRRLADTGRVIDTLVGQGANQINGPTFRIDQPDPALDEARTAAVGKARARAELYAKAVGMRVRRVLSINEGTSMVPPPYPVPVMARAASMDMKQESTPVAPGEVQLNASVNMVFELE